MMSIVMLNVLMLNVMAPLIWGTNLKKINQMFEKNISMSTNLDILAFKGFDLAGKVPQPKDKIGNSHSSKW